MTSRVPAQPQGTLNTQAGRVYCERTPLERITFTTTEKMAGGVYVSVLPAVAKAGRRVDLSLSKCLGSLALEHEEFTLHLVRLVVSDFDPAPRGQESARQRKSVRC